MDAELKRIHFHKIDVVPTGEEHDGEPLGRLTVVFHVLDNPIPILAILWGSTILAGVSSAGTWFVIDKLESFSETVGGKVLMIAAAVIGIGAVALQFQK